MNLLELNKSPKVRIPNPVHHIDDLRSEINTFIKNYLFNLYHGRFSHPEIVVTKMMGCINYFHPLLKPPYVFYNDSTKILRFDDLLLFTSVDYQGESYEIVFKTVFIENPRITRITEKNQIFITGFTDGALYPEELLTALKTEAVKTSNIRNKILSLDPLKNNEIDLLTKLEVVDVPPVSLPDIFLPENKVREFRRFIYEIMNFEAGSSHPCPRFLLAGAPGTGKTQIINAILNETKGKITAFLCSGNNIQLDKIFEFCEQMEPTLLIIDDLDQVVGDRQDYSSAVSLRTFLNLMDGMLTKKNSIFILATTNVKGYIDAAASRPGRWSMVLDIDEITSDNYLRLVRRETEDKEIIGCFNEKILDELKSKKVTGALIVSLIDNLTSLKKMKGEITGTDFRGYFDLIYNGFYKSNSVSKINEVGFGN